MRNNPALLAKRLRAGPRAEKEATQKIIMALASTAFVALLIVPGLDHRFGWSRVPTFVVLAANLMVAVGLYIIFIVYKASPFTSATIQVEKDQKVISTGPYSIVRHPMYSGGLVMLLGTPPALGSCWGLLVLIPMLPILIWRLLGEEKFLSKNLPEYTEYCMKVHSRLIPGIYYLNLARNRTYPTLANQTFHRLIAITYSVDHFLRYIVGSFNLCKKFLARTHDIPSTAKCLQGHLLPPAAVEPRSCLVAELIKILQKSEKTSHSAVML